MGTRAGVELTAAAAEDPLLGEKLRAEPPEARSALLLEADRLQAGNESQRRLALTVYRALHADVDPMTEAGALRIAWTLAHTRGLPPDSGPLTRRAAETCLHADTQARAAVLAARLAEQSGDFEEAEAVLGRVLAKVRGTGSRVEFDALEAAARIAVDHEDCARALAFAAGALALPEDVASAQAVLRARRCRADAFGEMRDGVRFEREADAAEALLPRVHVEDRGALRSEILASRGSALLRRGLREDAVRCLERALEEGSDEGAPARRRRVHVLLARTMLDLRRADVAARHVARAIRIGGRDDVVEFEMELLQIRLQRTAGGPASACARARELVARLAGAGRRVLGPGRRARLATDLAQILGEPGGDLDAARRGYDLAATSLVQAIARADREAARVPELGALSEDDLAALREHRDRELAAHSDVQRTVARFFEDAVRREGPAFLAGRSAEAGMTACAWCGRLRGSDGRWLSVAHLLPSADTLELTHAACEQCSGPLLAELAAAVSRA